MIYNYFSAPTQAEGEERLREHYRKFGVKLPEEDASSLYPSAGELSGTWSAHVSVQSGTSTASLTIQMNADGTGTATFGTNQFTAVYADDKLTMVTKGNANQGNGTTAAYTITLIATVERKDGEIVLTGSVEVKATNGKTNNGTWTATKKD